MEKPRCSVLFFLTGSLFISVHLDSLSTSACSPLNRGVFGLVVRPDHFSHIGTSLIYYLYNLFIQCVYMMSDQSAGEERLDVVTRPEHFLLLTGLIKRSAVEMWWHLNVCLPVQCVCFLYGSELKPSILNCFPHVFFSEEILFSRRRTLPWQKLFEIKF